MNVRKAKYIFALFSVAVLAAICLYPLWAGWTANRLNKLILSDSEAEFIMSGRHDDIDVLTDIFFDEQKLIFDAGSNTVYYSLIEDDKQAYNPIVSTDSQDGSVSIGIVNDHITVESIASNTKMKMIIYDATRFYVCNLVCTTLPVISIDCPVEISDQDARMDITLVDNEKGSSKRSISSEGMIRTRGSTSSEHPKRSYKIALRDGEKNRDISFLGLRADDDWILYSCYADPERVRNVFSQNLWTDSCGTDNEYNLSTGSYYKYVELFLNGEYRGLYALGYKTDKKTLGISKMSNDEGLYKKINYSLSGFSSDESFETILDYYCDMEEHSNDRQYLLNSIDIDNALDFFLYITLIQGLDNIDENYLVLIKNFRDGKKAIYIPWDMDLSWGNMWNDDANNHISSYEQTPDQNAFPFDTSISQLLLNNDQETYDLLYSKYKYNRNNGWSEAQIDRLLDDLEKDLFESGAYYRDCERWPESGTIDNINSLEVFRQYVHERLLGMDEYMDRLKNGHVDNPLVTQTLKYKNVDDYRFVIDVKNGYVPDSPIFKDFIEYYGKDRVSVENNYNLEGFRVNNVYTANTEDRGIVLYSIKDDYCDVLNIDDPSRFRIDGNYISNLSLWLRCLDNVYGYVILQINDTNVLQMDSEGLLDSFEMDCGEYASVQEALGNNENLVFALNCDDKKGTLIENPYDAQGGVPTVFGEYTFFENGDTYGIYIDGMECQVDTIDNLRQSGIIITQYTKDWNEVTSFRN